MSLREGLYACLLTIIDTMSVRVSGSRLTSETCAARENHPRHWQTWRSSLKDLTTSESHRWLHQTHQTQSLLTQEHSHHETSYFLLTISASCAGTFDVLETSQHHLLHGCMSCTKFQRWCTDARELSEHPSQAVSTYTLAPSANLIFLKYQKNRWLEKTKKLKFYLSLMSTTLFVMSWVE